MNHKKQPELITFKCQFCDGNKTMTKSDWDKKCRDTGEPRFCKKECAYEGRKQETARRRAA